MEEVKELYELYSKRIYSYLYFLTKDRQLTEELVQETFYQACISIHRFNQSAKISTWLYQIAKHVYFKNTKNNRLSTYPIDSFFFLSHPDTPEKDLMEKESEKEIVKAIQQLDQTQQKIVILRIFHEMSFKEIGSTLGKTENWARVTFYRSKMEVQKLIRKEGIEE